jgi:hypothetical protein
MTRSDAEEICLNAMDEYLPKSVTKKDRKEMLHTMFYELADQNALFLDEDADEDFEEDGDETEDLTLLIR